MSDAGRAGSGSPRCGIRRRPVSFGNPSTATYQGSVYTAPTDRTAVTGADDVCSPSADTSVPTPLPSLIQGATSVSHMVAMVHVPPEQVPEGVLNLVRPHRPWIEYIRIVIEQGPSSPLDASAMESDAEDAVTADGTSCDDEIDENYAHSPKPSPLDTSSSNTLLSTPLSPTASAIESAASILAAEEQATAAAVIQTATRTPQSPLARAVGATADVAPPLRSYLILFQMDSESAADQMVQYLHQQPYTSLDETEVCSLHRVLAIQTDDDDDGASLLSPTFHGRPRRSGGGRRTTTTAAAAPSSVAPVVSSTEEDYYNCAVCLEPLQGHQDGAAADAHGRSAAILTTVCNHSFHIDCLLQWQDSPCPVCRYDHAGLNGTALSQCARCGRTDRVLVCLICGTVSCGGPTAGPRPPTVSDNNAAALSAPLADGSVSHARQHYSETLHAYALDTETQHVWDFAGQGYVHRLLQNKDDGKLVEGGDPHRAAGAATAAAFERPQNPGLSDAQEGEVVHRKLEGFANQYYTLLKSQLEQQRLYYEGRLQEVRREFGGRGGKPFSSPDLVAALRQERRQLSQRLERLQQRHGRVHEDVSFLVDMNESIESNIVLLKRELAQVQQERMEFQQSFQESFPALEAKVTHLMLQLEADLDGGDAVASTATNGDDRKPAAT